MEDTIARLVSGHGENYYAKTQISYYGQVYATISGRYLGNTISVLKISPRHIDLMETLIKDKQSKGQ